MYNLIKVQVSVQAKSQEIQPIYDDTDAKMWFICHNMSLIDLTWKMLNGLNQVEMCSSFLLC